MASVDEIPEDLRAIARRVPAEVRINQSPLELRIRCEEAASLLAEAETVSDDNARRKRRDAAKALNAMSLSAYLTEQGQLLNEIESAKQRDDMSAMMHFRTELDRLERDNPIPLERFVSAVTEVIAAEVEKRQAVARNRKPRWFMRFFKRGSK